MAALVFLLLASMLLVTNVVESPDTLPPECRLTALEEVTLFGLAENVDERTSANGNNYYLFDIVTDGGKCSYPAFSFQEPGGNTFPGVWKRNKFDEWQFEASGGGLDKISPAIDALGEIRSAQR